MPTKLATAQELADFREREPDHVLLDVRLARDYEAAHLPGAVNNAVLEVAFEGRMDEHAPDKDRAVCVYGHGRRSAEAEWAAGKLERWGYTRVHVYAGGLADWVRDGREVAEGEPLPPAPEWPTGRHEIDPEASECRWLGRNLLNSHWGTVGVARGHLEFTEGGLAGGEVVFDLTDIACDDLAGNDAHDMLIAHLASDDFFDTERWPEARFTVEEGRLRPDVTAGRPNLEVAGTLTVKDVSEDVAALMAAGVGPDGTVGAQGTVVIDRTRWNVLYGSARIFERVAGHLVNDEIELRLRLVLKEEAGR